MFHKLAVVCALLVCSADAATAQTLSEAKTIPLVVEEGFPLQVVLTEALRFKDNEPVRARIVEPVYAFDREVVPSGAELIGRITDFHKPGKWKRMTAMLGGDFTPTRQPEITFETLILPDGTRTPVESVAIAAGETHMIRFDGPKGGTDKAVQNALVSTVKKPGNNHLKKVLWSLSPYRPQSLPAGTVLDAALLAPLNLGFAVLEPELLARLGSQPPAAGTISARLVTSLDSRKNKPGAPVEAVLTRPVFSEDHQLIFPVGSRLRGEILEVKAARMWHRNGQLAFEFATIETPASEMFGQSVRQQISGHLASVQVASDMNNVRINNEGEMRIVESKKRFIAPAYALVKAGRSVNSSADPLDRALIGAYQSKVTKGIKGSDPGFGLPGSVTGAMVPQVGIGLGLYGAGRSIYSNFFGRGKDIRFPVDTLMEIRLD